MSGTQIDRRPQWPSTQQATALAVLLFGLVYGYRSLAEGVIAGGELASGFFPLLVAAGLVTSCAIVLAQERRLPSPGETSTDRDGDQGSEGEAPVQWGRVALVLLAALAVPLFAETVGFIASLSVAMMAIAKIMGQHGWWRPAALGVGFGVVAWLVFVYWLFVPLPSGVLGLA